VHRERAPCPRVQPLSDPAQPFAVAKPDTEPR